MPTDVTAFQEMFDRDIQRVMAEIEAFPTDDRLWMLCGQVRNSAGTLGLHLAGNLQHFIGAVLGKSGYLRDREAEFSTRGLAKSEVLERLRSARDLVRQTLERLDAADLEAAFPDDRFGDGKTTAFVLLHLLGHLNYHLGQINYLRRVL